MRKYFNSRIDILKYVDHTNLKVDATKEEILKTAKEAFEFHCTSVCIAPCWVSTVRKEYPDLTITSVIGFPNGYSRTDVKCTEAAIAVQDGADEIDMVININFIKERKKQCMISEINAVKEAIGNKTLKVIIESGILTDDEIRFATEAVCESNADFIKTSTGFAKNGASPEAIEIIKSASTRDLKIKAAGGIKTVKDVKEYLRLGVDRIGASSVISNATNIYIGDVEWQGDNKFVRVNFTDDGLKEISNSLHMVLKDIDTISWISVILDGYDIISITVYSHNLNKDIKLPMDLFKLEDYIQMVNTDPEL